MEIIGAKMETSTEEKVKEIGQQIEQKRQRNFRKWLENENERSNPGGPTSDF